MGVIALIIIIYLAYYTSPLRDKESVITITDIREIKGLPNKYYIDFDENSLNSDITIFFFNKTKIIIDKRLKKC